MNGSLVLVILALVLLVLGPIVLMSIFTPERANSLRIVEAAEPDIAVQVAYLRFRHPELQAKPRVDRHPTYIWIHLALFAYGWIVLHYGVPYDPLGSDALGIKETLAFSLIVGSGLALAGLLMGKKVGRLVIARKVRENVASPVLADDITGPYLLGICGCFSTGISMTFYQYTVIASAGLYRLVTTLGGVLSFAILGLCATLIFKFVKATRKYIAARALLIEEAYARIDEE